MPPPSLPVCGGGKQEATLPASLQPQWDPHSHRPTACALAPGLSAGPTPPCSVADTASVPTLGARAQPSGIPSPPLTVRLGNRWKGNRAHRLHPEHVTWRAHPELARGERDPGPEQKPPGCESPDGEERGGTLLQGPLQRRRTLGSGVGPVPWQWGSHPTGQQAKACPDLAVTDPEWRVKWYTLHGLRCEYQVWGGGRGSGARPGLGPGQGGSLSEGWRKAGLQQEQPQAGPLPRDLGCGYPSTCPFPRALEPERRPWTVGQSLCLPVC